MKDLFDYYDYRKFLTDYYEERKSEAEFFSYRYMAGKINIEHSTLIKVMKGQRHLPLSKVEGIANLCSLSKEKQDYFEALLRFSRAKTTKESQFYFDRIQAIRGVPRQKLTQLQFNFFRHWYYSAIWALMNCFTFTGNMKELAQKLSPNVSEKAVTEAVEELVALKLLSIDNEGVYQRSANNILSDEQLRSVAKAQFLRKSCQLSADAIDRYPQDERDIATLIIDIPEEKFDEIKELLAEFRRNLINRVNSYEKSDKVYQVSTQLFPLSK